MGTTDMTGRIQVAVAGAAGRMGREVVQAVQGAGDLALVAQADAGDDLGRMLVESGAQAVVDFTIPEAVMANIETALAHRVVPIVGTTGLGPTEIEQVRALCRAHGTGALVAPNFAIGAVLMMRFCQE